MLLLRCIIYIFGTLIGFSLGVFITNVRKSNGVIIVDKNDPNKDTYRLELYDLDKLDRSTWVRFRILNKDSQ